jgi:hypothetical protein
MKEKHVPELKDEKWLNDLAFLLKVVTYLNEFNTLLQTQGQLGHELYGHVKSFQNKLRLWEDQLRNGNVYHFIVFNITSMVKRVFTGDRRI